MMLFKDGDTKKRRIPVYHTANLGSRAGQPLIAFLCERLCHNLPRHCARYLPDVYGAPGIAECHGWPVPQPSLAGLISVGK